MTVSVVLAGGRSERWGSEKAVARVRGALMVTHVAKVLGREGGRVAVNAPEASGVAAWARSRDLPVLPDPPDLPHGPLAGVVAGLEWAAEAGAEVLVTAPCDTPDLPRDYLRRIVAGLGEAPAAYATTAEGSHPLCAAWRVALLPQLREVLTQGHPSVRRWLEAAGARPVRFRDARLFRNLNRPPRAGGALVRLLDALAAILLLLLAIVGVVAILFAFTFGDALTPQGQARHEAQARLASVVCIGLVIAAVAAALWLARGAGASRRR